MKRFSASLLVLATLILPALADPADTHDHPPVMDNIVLNLAVEDWVETQTARVVVSVSAAVPGSDAGRIRTDMLKAVNGLASGAQWRFSSFNRSQDQSGLERSDAQIEARLKETDLGGLADKAKQASHPGLQLRVQEVDFTPTLAETEAVRAKLRNEIYGEVNDELKRLSTAEPDRKFRMGTINFIQNQAMPMQNDKAFRRMNMNAAAPMMATNGAEADMAPITVQQKVQMQAYVELSAVAPKE